VKLCKLSIGVKPSRRMFRITSLAGEIVDEILDLMEDKNLPADYFTRVIRAVDGSSFRLADQKNKNWVSVDTENILFVNDHYDEGSGIHLDPLLKEFNQVWEACNGALEVRNIRRIGMVGEFRFEANSKNPTAALLNHLTRLDRQGHVSKFALQFETHALTTGENGLPDVKTSDFWNTIESYYDSVLDTEHAEEGYVTAMLDVQRYYMPLLSSSVADEVHKLRKRFDTSAKHMFERLTKLGLMYAPEKK
jgi:hypothetical protein